MSGKQRIVRRAGAVLAAVRWLQRFRRDDISKLSDEDLAEWAAWSADDHHRELFLRVRQLWRSLPTLAGIVRASDAELVSDEYDGSVPISEWLARKRPTTGK